VYLSLIVLAALGALVVAGCGSSSSSSSEAASTASAATETGGSEAGESGGSEAGGEGAAAGGAPGGFEISEEAQACLKEQGVELPEFKAGQGGPPNGGEIPEGAEPPAGAPQNGELPEGGNFKKMQEAFKTCGVEMQGGPNGAGAGGQNSAAFKTQVTEYVACVRENGYELPEPNLSGKGPVFDESKVDQEDPEFKKASAKCQGLLRGGASSESSGE
jgi:hypothetical protein